jgi:peptide/nickel transport system substrate-binding protein/oligopeptide transport system substrate-binding protein
VLRIGTAALASLDPAQARTVDQLLAVDQLFDGLTAIDPATSEARPALAARWTASADQRVWEFTLRPGAKFSNGRAVEAADVKYTLDRISAPGSGSPGAELLTAITESSVVSPSVVRIVVGQPWSAFPAVLASPVFGIVPKEAVEAPAPAVFADRPSATSGPYRVASRTADRVRLAAVAGRGARVSAVDLVELADPAAEYREFRAGRLDWATVPPEEVESAARRFGRSAFRPYAADLFYGFNLKSPKLADPRFREAIVRGIDRRAIVAAVYGATVVPMDGVVPRGVAGWQRDPCGARCRYDPAAAKVLVAAVFGSGPVPSVQIAFDDDPAQDAVARAIQAGLAGVGIPVELAPKSLKDYSAFVVSGQEEVFRLGWVARYPSADDFLPPLFGAGSPNNLVGLSSGAVDASLAAARSAGDPRVRDDAYRAAERAVMDAVAVIPIAQFEVHGVVSKRVRGLRLTSMGTFDASAVSLH